MLLINSILNLALLGFVAGFVVPLNQTDGAYMVLEGSDTPIPISIDAFTRRMANPHSPNTLLKRVVLDNPQLFCDGTILNPVDYHNAYTVGPPPAR